MCTPPSSGGDGGQQTGDGGTPDAGCLTCGGVCIDADSDPKNCGGCGNDCTKLPNVNGKALCVKGACVLPPEACVEGYAHCSSNVEDGCETRIDEPGHCGSCITTCTGAAPKCTSMAGKYSCVAGCPSAAPDECGGTCVDLKNDARHCGACGNDCSKLPNAGPGAFCSNGECQLPATACKPGFAHCNLSATDGCETDVRTTANCGGCNVACGSATPVCAEIASGVYACRPSCTGATPTD
ncbi:MAG: hypothetical protein ACK4N5_18555, partial [Myxococcales bacterium]